VTKKWKCSCGATLHNHEGGQPYDVCPRHAKDCVGYDLLAGIPYTSCSLQICQLNRKCQMPDHCGPTGCNLVKRIEYQPMYKQ
jgi:hypothetical protein